MRILSYNKNEVFQPLFVVDQQQDFKDGVKDCKAGWAPKHDASKQYLDGYGEQYEREEKQSAGVYN
jgi:hypothetical protein